MLTVRQFQSVGDLRDAIHRDASGVEDHSPPAARTSASEVTARRAASMRSVMRIEAAGTRKHAARPGPVRFGATISASAWRTEYGRSVADADEALADVPARQQVDERGGRGVEAVDDLLEHDELAALDPRAETLTASTRRSAWSSTTKPSIRRRRLTRRPATVRGPGARHQCRTGRASRSRRSGRGRSARQDDVEQPEVRRQAVQSEDAEVVAQRAPDIQRDERRRRQRAYSCQPPSPATTVPSSSVETVNAGMTSPTPRPSR